ncbi:MAG: hypothetical protein LBQ67_03990 [Treponema sp.]|jgi:hypothetical protein|nr:hypothetical protein [Treponema sp.]
MKQAWKIFWKLFGTTLAAVFVVGIVVGTIKQSPSIVYQAFQQILAVGLGVCGIIGLFVVPIEMFIEDRKERRDRVVK